MDAAGLLQIVKYAIHEYDARQNPSYTYTAEPKVERTLTLEVNKLLRALDEMRKLQQTLTALSSGSMEDLIPASAAQTLGEALIKDAQGEVDKALQSALKEATPVADRPAKRARTEE